MTDIWNVVVNLDLKWYRSQLDLINVILKQVETYQKNRRSLSTGRYVNWQEIKYLPSVLEQLNLELDLETLLPLVCQKRRLLNFGRRCVKLCLEPLLVQHYKPYIR